MSKNESKPKNTLYSGFIAGAVSSIATWPLNVLQVQSQVSGHIPKGVKNPNGSNILTHQLVRNIYTKQGPKGFYRGVSKGIWAYSIFYGSFFYSNDLLKNYFPQNSTLSTLVRSYVAAGIGSIVSNPFHVVRVRCQSELLRPSYKTISITQIYKTEGFGALTKGLRTTLVKNWELSIIVFLHEYLSEQYALPAYVSSGIGKLVATSITYPLDSYRTARRFDSSLSMRQIISNFRVNPRKIYWGYEAYLLRSIPATVIAFHIRSILTGKN